jgi:hypothetical protein
MIRKASKPSNETVERAAIRRRIKRLYDSFNHENWAKCFDLIDPKLTAAGRIDPATYSQSLHEFKQYYGSVQIRHIEISLYLDARSKQDDRPFAYVYVFWQDDKHAFHLFKERWVKQDDHWFTRVVGLVAHQHGESNGD